MRTRRDFLQLGIAASALPFADAAFLSSKSTASVTPPTVFLYKAVFDERFPESVSFARQMEKLGVLAHGIAGDITDFWFHELHAQWTKEPVAIAGLTAHGPLFCLERLAWDHRMRVVYRAEHRQRDNSRIEHALRGPASMLRQTADLVGGGADWGLQVANVVSRCPNVCSEVTETTIIAAVPNSSDRGESANTEQEPLLSWVIAPAARA